MLTPNRPASQLAARRTARARARARRMAAARHRHARLQLRGGHRGRRPAGRDRPATTRVARVPGLCPRRARSSTSTAASAASTFSGRGPRRERHRSRCLVRDIVLDMLKLTVGAACASLLIVLAAVRSTPAQAPTPRYVGSAACQTCHAAIYERWSKTRMANVVRDPREHPDAIIPDFVEAGSARDVHEGRRRVRLRQQVEAALLHEGRRRLLPAARAVGRHAQACGGRYFVQPNTDWWVPLYPADNMQRPTGPLCDGCHSVNYDVADEDGHGVERRLREVPRPRQRARAPADAREHRQSRAARLRARQRHVHPVPLAGPAADESDRRASTTTGRSASTSGSTCKDFWKLEEHKLGETTFTHFADGTAHKNRMQGNDFVQSLMYTRGVTCFSCHDVARHGEQRRSAIKPAQRRLPDVPRTDSRRTGRTRRRSKRTRITPPAAPGSECVACHMPKIEQTIADVNVRSHTFTLRDARSHRARKDSERVQRVPHRQDHTVGASTRCETWPERSPWR